MARRNMALSMGRNMGVNSAKSRRETMNTNVNVDTAGVVITGFSKNTDVLMMNNVPVKNMDMIPIMMVKNNSTDVNIILVASTDFFMGKSTGMAIIDMDTGMKNMMDTNTVTNTVMVTGTGTVATR